MIPFEPYSSICETPDTSRYEGTCDPSSFLMMRRWVCTHCHMAGSQHRVSSDKDKTGTCIPLFLGPTLDKQEHGKVRHEQSIKQTLNRQITFHFEILIKSFTILLRLKIFSQKGYMYNFDLGYCVLFCLGLGV